MGIGGSFCRAEIGFYPSITEPGWSQTTRAVGTVISTENLDSGDGTQIVYPGMEGSLVVQSDALIEASIGFSFPLTRT